MAIEPELKGYLEGVRYRLRLDPAAEKEALLRRSRVLAKNADRIQESRSHPQ